MRVFKSNRFHRWQKKVNMPDSVLCEAAREIINGVVEVDLGGGVLKKRIARQGEGKSSGYRTLVAFKSPLTHRIIFMYSFAKNVRSNIKKDELQVLKKVANSFFCTTHEQINEQLQAKDIHEVNCNE